MTTIILNVCVCLPLTRSVKEFAHSIVSANDAHPRNLLSCPTFENIRFIIAHYQAHGSSGTFWKGAFFCWSKTQVLVFFFRCATNGRMSEDLLVGYWSNSKRSKANWSKIKRSKSIKLTFDPNDRYPFVPYGDYHPN